MNKTGLIAKISIKYVLPTCIWKYFWRISRYFAFFGEFQGDFAEIPEFRGSAAARNIRSPGLINGIKGSTKFTSCYDYFNMTEN